MGQLKHNLLNTNSKLLETSLVLLKSKIYIIGVFLDEI